MSYPVSVTHNAVDGCLNFLSQKIAHCPSDQIRFLKETAGSWFPTNELLDLGPLIEKKT